MTELIHLWQIKKKGINKIQESRIVNNNIGRLGNCGILNEQRKRVEII